MSRIAYVNGRYVPHGSASVHIEDRGYQFADGVYEVVTVHKGRLVDEEGHLDRLDRSLRELRIASPMSRPSLRTVMRELLRRNRVRQGIIYIQATRGVARRDHPFPASSTPSLVMTARASRPPDPGVLETGKKAVSVPENRWARRDIKSISLLPNILAKQTAREAGAYEALFVDGNGHVTEGASTNVWIVSREGALVTRATGNEILSGITRATIHRLAGEEGIELLERPFTLAEAKRAREVFVTSATSHVLPIVQIDDAVIGNGKPGAVSRRLFEIYCDYMESGGAAA